MSKIICKNTNDLVGKKLQHDVGILIYRLLNDKEEEIQQSLTARNLIRYYNLKSIGSQNRCVCPFHHDAENSTSLEFSDTKKAFNCHSCGEHGTYLKFIALKEGFTKNEISEAKILAANRFTNLSLGFNSISDFESKLKALTLERYNKIKSLILNDYYDISLIDYLTTETKIKHTNSKYSVPSITKSNVRFPIENKNKEFKLEMFNIEKTIREINSDEVLQFGDFRYRISLDVAKKSKLIKEFEINSNLNSNKKLYDFMVKKYDISAEIADKYELIAFIKSNQSLLKYPDFFTLNDRVLYPFKDHNTGITVGYQARTMDLNNKSIAKYINVTDFGDLKTKEGKTYRGLTQFAIGDFLFNIFELKDKKLERLFITEGAADAIKLNSFDYDSISPGQANLTDHQIYLIYKYFGKDIKLYLFFDNDKNNVGQNKSIMNAYRLHQFGFTSINIIRTYSELGTDVTDVATKIRNDKTLQHLIDLWIKNAYEFNPPDNKILNSLYQTRLFSSTQLMQIDPRNIEKINGNINQYLKLANNLNVQGKEFDTFKSLLNCNCDTLELLIQKISELITESAKDQPAIEGLKDDIEKGFNTPIVNNIFAHSSKITICNNTSNYSNDLLKKDWNIIKNISAKQLYIIKQKFDYDKIREINDLCNKKQILAIVGNIKKNIYFDINDFLHIKKSSIGIPNDFSPVDKDDIPF